MHALQIFSGDHGCLSIRTDRKANDFAWITKETSYDYPVETDMPIIDGQLYFAGGHNEYFKA